VYSGRQAISVKILLILLAIGWWKRGGLRVRQNVYSGRQAISVKILLILLAIGWWKRGGIRVRQKCVQWKASHFC
jgi:hypothetical protein